MRNGTRQIGPIGTAARALTGLALLYVAGGATIASWGIEWQDAAIGLVALPAVMIGLGLLARRCAAGPIRFTGPLGIALNLAVIVALVTNDFTGGGATIFYGATLLIAAWHGQAGCEATVISNLILGRDDQIGCPTLPPIDAAESHLRARSREPGRAVTRESRRTMEGETAMTKHDAPEHDLPRQARGERRPNPLVRHSLAGAAICLGTGAAIALIAMLG